MEDSPIDELLRSHAELRATLIFAGKQLKKNSRRRERDPALPILRRALRESRKVAKQFATKSTYTTRIKLTP
jgi:hypothetical protein